MGNVEYWYLYKALSLLLKSIEKNIHKQFQTHHVEPKESEIFMQCSISLKSDKGIILWKFHTAEQRI